MLEYQSVTSTEDLLGYADFCNYKNVVLIDYSCDVCINYSGENVPRNQVINIRNEKINTNLFGRGIHKKLKKSKKRRVTRKLQKSKKVKKNRKNKTRKYKR